MNKDIRDGLVIGVAFAGLVSLFPTQANAQIDGEELCRGAVEYSVKYMPEDDAFELHQARWNILDGDNTNDDEKLVGLVMFEIGQRVSYSMNEENNRSNEVWWNDVLESMFGACEAAVEEMNQPDLSEMEPAGDIW